MNLKIIKKSLPSNFAIIFQKVFLQCALRTRGLIRCTQLFLSNMNQVIFKINFYLSRHNINILFLMPYSLKFIPSSLCCVSINFACYCAVTRALIHYTPLLRVQIRAQASTVCICLVNNRKVWFRIHNKNKGTFMLCLYHTLYRFSK